MVMMRFGYRPTRCLITAGLIVSLGLTGLFPQMMVWAETRPLVAARPRATECCCGTADGRCCGMGCCMARQPPAKERCPCPNPKDTRDGQNILLALALAKAHLSDGGGPCGSHFGQPETGSIRSPVDSTLQAKRVRIDA